MKTTIIAELEKFVKNKKIDDWKLVAIKLQRANQYITKNFETESFLESNRVQIAVTVYRKIGDKLGDSSFMVIENDVDVIKKQIEEAVQLSEHSQNEAYSIPEKDKSGEKVELADQKIVEGFAKDNIHIPIGNMCEKARDEVKRHKGVKLNGMELLVSYGQREVMNSKGLVRKQEKTTVYTEMVLTTFNEEKEMEFFPMLDVSRLSDLKIEEFVAENIQKAKDVLNSSSAPNFEGGVLLSGDALREYFCPELSPSPLIMHSLARLKYMKLSNYKRGKPVADNVKGDLLTLYSNPLVQYNPHSSNFDDEGTSSIRVLVIDNGMVENYLASKRFADYLGLQATGTIGCVEIKPGSATVDELYAGEFLEIVSFASFTPNGISGDFSAEIRLGYMWKDGKKTAFRGGMFTGNVFKLLENMKLSKESVVAKGYFGPKVVLFKEAVIAGI